MIKWEVVFSLLFSPQPRHERWAPARHLANDSLENMNIEAINC